MNKIVRFGKSISVPATVQIVHELRMMMASDRIEALKTELSVIEHAQERAALERKAVLSA